MNYRLLRATLPLLAMIGALAGTAARAQSPELLMRDLASGQIKKGVRSIGFGGDGATWGNYALVWKDAATALVDYGDTAYDGGNDIHFSAVGFTTPALWNDLAVYLVAMSQSAQGIRFDQRSPALGTGPAAVAGDGADHALFAKLAMPLGGGFSAGMLLAYEKSHFDAVPLADPANAVRFETQWRPSGGFGLTWQPSPVTIVGARILVNDDWERRIDALRTTEGLAQSRELRGGASTSPWNGALIDVGWTHVERDNAIAGVTTHLNHPNLGIEQGFQARTFVLRAGVDETSPTFGFSYHRRPVLVDVAYVRNMARARVGNVFGDRSDSVLLTVTVNYEEWLHAMR